MRPPLAPVALSVLFAAAAAATEADTAARAPVPSSDALALALAHVALQPLERRQDASASVSLTPGDGSNATDWDRETDAACVAALRLLPRITNPSGNCVCYNLPALDTGSVSFTSEIRVYRVSQPRDGFAGVLPSAINVGVRYGGASVSPVSGPDFDAMTAGANRPARRDETRQPQLLQTYRFVGQIDQDRLRDKPSTAELEALLTPTFTLTARNTEGGAVSTNLSLNEASFVTGVFSKQVVLSEVAAASAAVDAKVAAVRNGTVAFVQPGIQIMVFPVGAIITSVWALLGLAAYGFGTYERVVYAKAYRRRQAAKTP